MTVAKAPQKSKQAKSAHVALVGGYIRLSPQERVEDIKAFGREVRASKESAIAFLHSAGIVTKSGKLTKHYR